MTAAPTRAVLIEAMARAHCRENLRCDPDARGKASGVAHWRLVAPEMEPVLDALIATQASLQTLAPVLGRIAGRPLTLAPGDYA